MAPQTNSTDGATANGAPATGRRRLFLMRHGHVDYFAPDLTDPRMAPLTEDGERQARAARDALARVDFDFAAHSGLPRAAATAAIALGERASPTPEAIPALEELRSGPVRVESREALAAQLAFCFDDADAPGAAFLPGGETFADASARIEEGLRTLISARAWRTALVVAHEGVNRIVLGQACAGGLATIAAFEQDLGCVNVIDFDVARGPDGVPRVERAILKAVNVTPYDYVKHGLPRTSLEHLFGVDFGKARPDAPQSR